VLNARQRSCLRILLRSSPIVAIADTTLLIEAIIVEAVRTKSVRSAIGTILNGRFEDAGSHKSERYILLRWITVVVPAIAQNLGIARAELIPWSKTWSFCYLLSFIVVEVSLLLLRWTPQKKAAHGRTSTSTVTGCFVSCWSNVP